MGMTCAFFLKVKLSGKSSQTLPIPVVDCGNRGQFQAWWSKVGEMAQLIKTTLCMMTIRQSQ